MEPIRQPTFKEKKLLKFLMKKASMNVDSSSINNLLVCPMKDGGLGSLCLYPNGKIIKDRKFGCEASNIHFYDTDGVYVIASLYLDEDGNVFEIDVWKVNNEKLISLPNLVV